MQRINKIASLLIFIIISFMLIMIQDSLAVTIRGDEVISGSYMGTDDLINFRSQIGNNFLRILNPSPSKCRFVTIPTVHRQKSTAHRKLVAKIFSFVLN